jgi:hypothetical protein
VVEKPPSWFVMGPSQVRIACELVERARADGRQRIIQIVGPSSYTSALSFVLSNRYGLQKFVLSTEQASSSTDVRLLSRALLDADAYLLLTTPDTASSLVFALESIGALIDPSRFYLAPTLHTPAFLETIPKGTLDGARGISPGTAAGAAEFRTKYVERWQDDPFDDAFSSYDAGAIAALAIQRALRDEHAIPAGRGLSVHLGAVTKAGGLPVRWNEIDRGLEIVRDGGEVQYIGLTGELQFDALGKPITATIKWWAIDDGHFSDIPHGSNCQ